MGFHKIRLQGDRFPVSGDRVAIPLLRLEEAGQLELGVGGRGIEFGDPPVDFARFLGLALRL